MREKYRVKIARPAETDLAEIWTYIAADSVDDANQFNSQTGEANENT